MLRKALAVSALLTLTACGAQEVDIKVVEEDITSGVKKQAGADVTVDCPDQVDWETGKTFTCDVKDSKGQTQKAVVTMKDDKGNVTWNLG